ncbi:MAG: dethiobiotin synthase, partial [Mariprofundus sp.]|nr:dethiobiotin synthase [Mariprofundus sp.]
MGCNVFITATDTEAGKTWVTASAICSLLQQGVHARALKPVACGVDEAGKNEDIERLLAAQGLENANDINLYHYALPAAPSQAAAAEGQRIDTDHLVQWCHRQSEDVHTCLIEGVGGLMAPLTDSLFVSDWIAAMP